MAITCFITNLYIFQYISTSYVYSKYINTDKMYTGFLNVVEYTSDEICGFDVRVLRPECIKTLAILAKQRRKKYQSGLSWPFPASATGETITFGMILYCK